MPVFLGVLPNRLFVQLLWRQEAWGRPALDLLPVYSSLPTLVHALEAVGVASAGKRLTTCVLTGQRATVYGLPDRPSRGQHGSLGHLEAHTVEITFS